MLSFVQQIPPNECPGCPDYLTATNLDANQRELVIPMENVSMYVHYQSYVQNSKLLKLNLEHPLQRTGLKLIL